MNAETQMAHWNVALAPLFRKGFLPPQRTAFQFIVLNGEAFHLLADNKAFEFFEGYDDHPTLTLSLPDRATAWDLITGAESGMDAFMSGRYRADGNIVLSQLLLFLFEQPADIQSQQIID